MTDNTEPTIDLYQKITDICFENGGATKPMVDKLYGLISDQVAKARIEEVLQMRAVGDRYASRKGADFEGLCSAYDAHIMKRAADLTTPNQSNKGD